MCGLLFSISSNLNSKFEEALEKQIRRGPDDFGYEFFENKKFFIQSGFRRLSIEDLSSKGHQPMYSLNGRYSILFNGEIYNFKEIKKVLLNDGTLFKSNSDTEVLLNAWIKWGDATTSHIEGMYTFLVFDKLKGILHCFRDPFGIKPCFYFSNATSIIISSDIKSIVDLINLKKIEKNVLLNYLILGNSDRNEKTFFKGLNRLLPGYKIKTKILDSILETKIDKWFLQTNNEIKKSKINFEDAKIIVRDRFLSSVDKQIQSNVPIGFSLSGGVDSSSIVCAAKYLYPDFEIKTFSYIPQSQHINEHFWIKKINNFVKSKSYVAEFKNYKFQELFSEFVEAQSEPANSQSFLAEFLLYKSAKEEGMKVMLDGHGADEIFCGYEGYPDWRLYSLLKQGNLVEYFKFSKGWSRWPSRSLGKLTKNIMFSFLRYFGINPYFLKKIISISKMQKFFDEKLFFDVNDYDSAIIENPFLNKLFLDTTILNCPPQLRCADNSAMYHSIENRVPFLNEDLFRNIIALPEEYLVSSNGCTKFILREAMRGLVPNEVLYRKDKIGYAADNFFEVEVDVEFKNIIKSKLFDFDFLNQNELLNLIFTKTHHLKLNSLSWRFINVLFWANYFDLSI